MPMTKNQKIGVGVAAALASLLALLGFSQDAGADSIPGKPTGPGPGPDPDPEAPGPGGLKTPEEEPEPPGGLKTPEADPEGGEAFDPGVHESLYPTPTRMYQVRKGDILGGEDSNRSIIYRALLSAAYTAAIEDGATDAEAKAFAKSIAKNGNLRRQYRDAMQCVGLNDAAYGTWGYGDKAKPGPHGRAIRLLRYHANNRQRLMAGKGFIRNIRWGDWKTPGDKSGTPMDPELADEYEYFFLPGLNHAALLQGEIIVDMWEPPFAWTIDMPEGMENQLYGCEGGEIVLS